MPQLLNELLEYEDTQLAQLEFSEPLRPTRLSRAELLHEIKLYLKGGKATKRLSVEAGDILTVQRNLRRLLDRAEKASSRQALAEAYCTGALQDAAEVYRHHRSRYASADTAGPLEMNSRIALARAACGILKKHNPRFDETAALLQILGPAALSYVKFNAETVTLLDNGRWVSDAWFGIVRALDIEIGLSSWFAALPIVDDAVAVAELLGIETSPGMPVLRDELIETLQMPRMLSVPDEVYVQ